MSNFEYIINLGFIILQIYGIVSLLVFIPIMIDILKLKKGTKYKVVWLAISLALGAIGALIYCLVEKKMLRFRR
ncbi:MAG: hypothetical protein QXX38_02530 [Candidatus Aenigmatarchaeota archaeon]